MNKVVHCQIDDYDVYIGRGKCPKTGKFSRWANPFKIGPDGDRENVVKLYLENLIINRHDLLEQICILENKTLGCWCSPNSCHGDILHGLSLYNKKIQDFNLSGKSSENFTMVGELSKHLEKYGIDNMVKKIYGSIK